MIRRERRGEGMAVMVCGAGHHSYLSGIFVPQNRIRGPGHLYPPIVVSKIWEGDTVVGKSIRRAEVEWRDEDVPSLWRRLGLRVEFQPTRTVEASV